MTIKNSLAWFLRASQHSGTKLRLFCFPYAGGAASIYRSWAGQIPQTVEIIAVELPGRGKRTNESPIRRLPALIEALMPMMIPLLDMKFALFGHSMGAIIAFELARELRRRNERQPEQIFVSGREAPQIPRRDPVTYDFREDEFRTELLRLKGTPIDVLENAELMSLMLPLLRADFELIQTYEYCDELPLQCPISVYGGLQDYEITREGLLRWKQQTDGQFKLDMLPGDHFFLRSASSILLELLRHELSRITIASYQPGVRDEGRV